MLHDWKKDPRILVTLIFCLPHDVTDPNLSIFMCMNLNYVHGKLSALR